MTVHDLCAGDQTPYLDTWAKFTEIDVTCHIRYTSFSYPYGSKPMPFASKTIPQRWYELERFMKGDNHIDTIRVNEYKLIEIQPGLSFVAIPTRTVDNEPQEWRVAGMYRKDKKDEWSHDYV